MAMLVTVEVAEARVLLAIAEVVSVVAETTGDFVGVTLVPTTTLLVLGSIALVIVVAGDFVAVIKV